MNKRIEQLALQSDIHRDKFGMYFAGDKHDEDGVDLEKFAELFLAECLEVIKNAPRHCAYTTYDKDIVECAIEESANALKKHFGV